MDEPDLSQDPRWIGDELYVDEAKRATEEDSLRVRLSEIQGRLTVFASPMFEQLAADLKAETNVLIAQLVNVRQSDIVEVAYLQGRIQVLRELTGRPEQLVRDRDLIRERLESLNADHPA